jgi:group I intron endonuclease
MAYGIIYKATNIINGKVYIGKTIKTLRKRKSNHKFQSLKGDRRYMFQIALLDEGFENFTWEQIDTAENEADLNAKEELWVAHYKANDPQYGYNGTGGGNGFKAKHTEDTKHKMSEAAKGRTFTQEQYIKAGEAQRGERHPKNTTAEATARAIKADIKAGMRICEIMRKYGVTKSVISNIKHGYSWAWLQITA